MASSLALLNDKLLPVDDPALSAYNSSLVIYEVIRVINGKCLFLEDHLTRLFISVSLAARELSKTNNDLSNYLSKLVDSNSLQNGNIRLDICYQATELNLVARIIPHKYPAADDYRLGVKAITYNIQRENPNAKILNPSLREEINKLINTAGAWEALLINRANNITEGSRSNLFAIQNNLVITPPSGDVLPGITRGHIINLCKHLALNVTERNINSNEISQFNCFFITGTSPKILPLNQIDEIQLNVENYAVRQLINAYDERIQQYLDDSSLA